MPSLVGTSAAANYLKASPTTKMGTRELLFLQIDMNTDVETGYTDSNSLYAKAIRGLELVCEVYAIGTPNGNWFTAVVAADTAPLNANQAPQDGSRVTAIETAVNSATSASSNVWNAFLNGSNIENDC